MICVRSHDVMHVCEMSQPHKSSSPRQLKLCRAVEDTDLVTIIVFSNIWEVDHMLIILLQNSPIKI